MNGCGLAILCIEVDDYISLAENAIQNTFTYDLHECLDWQIYCNGWVGQEDTMVSWSENLDIIII